MKTPAPTEPKTPPSSSLYFGEVMHERFKPFSHRFTYKVFSAFLDIDRIDDVARKTRLFSRNRFNFYSFYDRDHGPRDGSSLRLHVEKLLKQAGQTFQPAEIRLLCYPRILGHVFNPLSIYYCYDRDGEIGALIYEVRNTFAEHHSYVAPIMRDEAGHAGVRQSRDKLFYVSPFIDMAAQYNFTLRRPGRRLHVLIRETAEGSDLLLATFKGTRHDLNGRNLMIAALKFPLMTLKVVAAINFEALRLWLKGAKLFSRPAAPPPPVSFVRGSKPGRDENECAHAAQ